jgi:mRNA interferase MazF
VTICGFTNDPTDLPLFRVAVQPTPSNGLQSSSRIMVDKIVTVPKTKLGRRIASSTDLTCCVSMKR